MSGAIVVDTSAIMSIGLDELDAPQLLQILAQSERILIAAPSKLELGIVGINRNIYPRAMQLLDTFAVEVVAFDDALSIMAIKAFESYGKGRHKAALNFGDCCAPTRWPNPVDYPCCTRGMILRKLTLHRPFKQTAP